MYMVCRLKIKNLNKFLKFENPTKKTKNALKVKKKPKYFNEIQNHIVELVDV